jgi:hypothetical protein
VQRSFLTDAVVLLAEDTFREVCPVSVFKWIFI